MTQGALFFNPSSGARAPGEAEEMQQAVAGELDFISITPGLDIPGEIRKRFAEGQRLFVASGGDGTLNHVVQGVVETEARMAVIPSGTFNHFARDLNIPLEWRAALEIALHGDTLEIDAGKVNGRYFLNNISLGLYPEVVEKREQLRGQGKWKAYRYAAYDAMRRFPHVSLGVETAHHLEAIKTHIFMVSVNPYDLTTIGLVAPRVSTEGGGQLSVYWLPHLSKLQMIRTLSRYFRGKISPGADFRSVKASTLKVHSSKTLLKLGIDGELVEMKPPLLIQSAPKMVRVKVPKTRRTAVV